MCADSGAGAAIGGRGSDTSGRQETYARRFDPDAPGSTSPSFGQAFQYHAFDKFTPEQNRDRGILSLIPGAGVFQAAGAAIEAAEDMRMDKKDTDNKTSNENKTSRRSRAQNRSRRSASTEQSAGLLGSSNIMRKTLLGA